MYVEIVTLEDVETGVRLDFFMPRLFTRTQEYRLSQIFIVVDHSLLHSLSARAGLYCCVFVSLLFYEYYYFVCRLLIVGVRMSVKVSAKRLRGALSLTGWWICVFLEAVGLARLFH